MLIQESRSALAVLEALKELGVTLALDDFGTGYSSLIYLQRFPVDIIKIDRTFVTALQPHTTSRAIVDSIVRMAHDLTITVVAEGVETAEQYRQVSELGCDFCQGFYFAQPAPATEAALRLRPPALPPPRSALRNPASPAALRNPARASPAALRNPARAPPATLRNVVRAPEGGRNGTGVTEIDNFRSAVHFPERAGAGCRSARGRGSGGVEEL